MTMHQPSRTLADMAGEDILDLRDLWSRKTELEVSKVASEEEGSDEVFDEDDAEELTQLIEFFENDCPESEPASVYESGPEFNEPMLIRDTYFEEYAQQLAEDIVPSSEMREAMDQWPYRHIDWEAAAKELEYDYTTVTLAGIDYFVRSY